MNLFIVFAFVITTVLFFLTTSNDFNGMFYCPPRHQFSTHDEYDKAWARTEMKNRIWINTLGIIMLSCVVYWLYLAVQYIRINGWA